MKRCLVFDIWGDYAHFRKFYTTSSPLTYPFPSKPTLIGIISAILGLSNDGNQYLKSFRKDEYFLGLRILNPVKTIHLTENFVDVKKFSLNTRISEILGKEEKNNKLPHTQIRLELLKEPRYRVYFAHKDEGLFNDLKRHLQNHTAVYTVSLGLSENLANFELIDEKTLSEVRIDEGQSVEVASVLRKDFLQKLTVDFNAPLNLKVLNYPVEMLESREVTVYQEYVYEENGRKISAKVDSAYKIGEEYVCQL